MVVLSKDDESPFEYVVYIVVTSVPPEIERDRLETDCMLLTDCSLADETEAWDTDDSESHEVYPAS